MKHWLSLVVFLSLLGGLCRAQDQSHVSYPADPDMQPQSGVPKGDVLHFRFRDSRIYPGTERDYWVYVPAQYDPATPACLFLDLDDIQFNAPVVFDNLIHKGEIPVTIGVFVGPGAVTDSTDFPARWNRSYEFDAVNDDFVRFIDEELLPDVEKKTAADGRPIRISQEGKDRAVAGCSSGGIGAFTAAWERPDLFSRVYSCIGTFVGMRGGDRYPVLVRKTEPKPIRVFLQDGVNDTWNPLFGNWFKANVDLEAALAFAGYEVGHAWGDGGHDGIQATAIFPDAIRWLWRGWPAPVGGGLSGNDMLRSVLAPGEGWREADTPDGSVRTLSADPAGNIYYDDRDGGAIYRLATDGTHTRLVANAGSVTSLCMDREGRLLAASVGKNGLTAYAPDGKSTTVWKKSQPSDLLALTDGSAYMTEGSGGAGRIVLARPDGRLTVVADSLYEPSGLALSPDRKLLFAADRSTHWIYSYLIAPDGSLRYGQRYYWLHTPESSDGGPDRSGAAAMAADRDGNLYVATSMGVQVCDRNGRVRLIMTRPEGEVTDLCFGGKDFDTLYIACGGRLYSRKMQRPGVPPLAAPIELSVGGPG